MHRRRGRGGGGGGNFGQLIFLGAARQIWATPVFKEVELELRLSGNGQIKKSSPALLILQNLLRGSGSRAENVREFSLCARIGLHDCFRNDGDNARR